MRAFCSSFHSLWSPPARTVLADDDDNDAGDDDDYDVHDDDSDDDEADDDEYYLPKPLQPSSIGGCIFGVSNLVNIRWDETNLDYDDIYI